MLEQLLWVRHFDTVEELRQALQEWRRLYNSRWLIERHGHRPPAEVRREHLANARIEYSGRCFVFTGTCAFGTRRECHEATEALGGRIATGVTKSVNYVVLGTYVTDSWIHETYGRKIEKAMKYRADGVPLAIVTEEHWVSAGDLA